MKIDSCSRQNNVIFHDDQKTKFYLFLKFDKIASGFPIC